MGDGLGLGPPSCLVAQGQPVLAAWGSCAGCEEAHDSVVKRTGVGGSVGSRQTALDAREVLIECEALINSGLAVRCDECTISLVPFNELCERCKVAVEGQAQDKLMWEAARPDLEGSSPGHFDGTPS